MKVLGLKTGKTIVTIVKNLAQDHRPPHQQQCGSGLVDGKLRLGEFSTLELSLMRTNQHREGGYYPVQFLHWVHNALHLFCFVQFTILVQC